MGGGDAGTSNSADWLEWIREVPDPIVEQDSWRIIDIFFFPILQANDDKQTETKLN
jgi:hypothetical protein